MSSKETGYKITTDSDFLDKQNAITPELSRKLKSFHKLAIAGKKSSLQKIKDAIELFPENPQLKNYLTIFYQQIGDTEKMYATNRWIVAEHPEYLFGKLNLANEYFQKQEFEKIPEVLGSSMELKLLYPDRDTFHLNEVTSFYKMAVLYFVAIDNIEQAEIRCDIMRQLAPEDDATDVALQEVFFAKMRLGHARFLEEERTRISVKTKQQEIKTIYKSPNFNHEETEWLYTNGLYIGEEKLSKILSLPQDSIIQDLELVLQDSINRYGYFNKLVEEKGWDEEKMNFVVHAIYLLGELGATKSIDSIINVLSQSEEYIELYLGDFVTSMIWEPLYKIAANNLEDCKQFMFKSGIYTYARTNFTDMLEQLALHQPDRKNEVLSWYKQVIQFYLNTKLEDNIIDSDVVGLLICNIIDIQGVELLPEIEKLFEQGIVSKGICGDWEEVRVAFESPNAYDNRKEILPMSARYEMVTSTWAGYNEENDNFQLDYDAYDEPLVLPVRTEPKIGRNESCPCGSGKKYKKCCLGK
ncbi:MAG: DUF1186 domain-containing protein [Flavobacteriales bacterium]|nr:DUF1186 domain-containing protein [Flavobacteriales bacterium]